MTHSQTTQTGRGGETAHLNLRWSIADADRIAAMARARNSAQRHRPGEVLMEYRTKAELAAHYADVRARLRSLPPPPPERPRRLVPVRPQPHRPGYVPPPERLPHVIVTEETKQRVRDILHLAQEARNFAPEPGYWRDIVDQVCAKHGVTFAELIGQRRAVHIAAARQEAVYRISRETSLSLPQIGKRIGGRDHTTIIHSIRRHEAKLKGEVYRQARYGQAAEAAGL